jgi:hypothetical protein
VPVLFEVVQERDDDGGVQVVPVEVRGQFAGAVVDEPDEQPQGVR